MSDSVRLDEILEAALLAAGEPLPVERLEGLFDERERPPRRELRDALAELAARLENSALELTESASGFQVRIRQRLSPWVSRLWDERPQRYSRALLETLALIAYRQPVTRGDIEEVRGVAVSSSIMRTLNERGWIRVVGHRDVPGRPAVYATTRQFLDDFGLKTLDALPPMHELKGFDLLEETRYEDEIDIQGAQASAGHAAPSEDGSTDDAPALNEPVAPESLQEGQEKQEEQQTTAGMADDETHAGMASDRPRLSFADLEARLAERARNPQTVESESDDDGLAGAEHSSDETTSDS
ncbi:segregation and condensation protein B [Modicisalibacter ilicicola DSM 19980]|uniref:Segregation and condensation protein B n=1 Tax=Modicisalibacter ilicicola DSM 19980 TaxID=1121942 RepID=A0A1M4US30_9GAMM|nr:SMC-Scp complex subunit ScpB [Halomonas ilicicola]SHE59433.1 segregation and condensation protein B [Halomonas ilicicola DSM 19980]